MDHLAALEISLSNERVRLGEAKTEEEKKLRQVWVNQLEKEVDAERGFLEIKTNLTDEELLKELGAI